MHQRVTLVGFRRSPRSTGPCTFQSHPMFSTGRGWYRTLAQRTLTTVTTASLWHILLIFWFVLKLFPPIIPNHSMWTLILCSVAFSREVSKMNLMPLITRLKSILSRLIKRGWHLTHSIDQRSVIGNWLFKSLFSGCWIGCRISLKHNTSLLLQKTFINHWIAYPSSCFVWFGGIMLKAHICHMFMHGKLLKIMPTYCSVYCSLLTGSFYDWRMKMF